MTLASWKTEPPTKLQIIWYNFFTLPNQQYCPLVHGYKATKMPWRKNLFFLSIDFFSFFFVFSLEEAKETRMPNSKSEKYIISTSPKSHMCARMKMLCVFFVRRCLFCFLTLSFLELFLFVVLRILTLQAMPADHCYRQSATVFKSANATFDKPIYLQYPPRSWLDL